MMCLDIAALEDPITRILTAPSTDLATISAKRVRKALLEDPQYAHLGLTSDMLRTRRADVDQVIARIFEHVSRVASSSRGSAKRKRGESDDEDEGDRDGDGDGDGDGGEEAGKGDDVQPPTEPSEDAKVDKSTPKKKKSRKSVEESDAALARKLSTEINSRSRRGAASAAGASSPRKAKCKPKSAETVESEEDDEDGERKPKKRGVAKGGFAKEYTLSVPLSAVLAVEKLSRPQVVKKLWEYIRQNELQNPSNKKEIICDDALRAVFSVDKIDMFRMNKVLGQHLHEG